MLNFNSIYHPQFQNTITKKNSTQSKTSELNLNSKTPKNKEENINFTDSIIIKEEETQKFLRNNKILKSNKKEKNAIEEKKLIIIDEDFTKEEKIKILNLNLQYGNKWTKIASFFQNKTERKIKNQFFSLIRKSLRTICRIKGIKNGTYLLNKIKTQSLSIFITHDLKIDFEELKKKERIFFKEKNLILNLFEYIKTFAFIKFSDIRRNIKIKDIFIANKCIDFLINLDSERAKSIYEKQRIYKKNHSCVKIESLNLDQYCTVQKSNLEENSNFELKNKLICELQNFKDFTNNIIENMKLDEHLYNCNVKKNYEITDIFKQKLQEKKVDFKNEIFSFSNKKKLFNNEKKPSFDRSVLLLFKNFNKNNNH